MIADGLLSDRNCFSSLKELAAYQGLTQKERRISVCNAMQRKIPAIVKVHTRLPGYKRGVNVYARKRNNPAFETFKGVESCVAS